MILPPTISIKAKVHDKPDEHIISQVEKPRDDFDQQKLMEVIDAYSSVQQRLNKKSWAFTVKAGEPSIKADHNVFFTLFNTTQEVEFNKNREEFVQYLRDKLNNQYILVHTEMKEKEEIMIKTIDPVTKFENMVKENPLLEKLRETFGLDL